MPDLYLKKHVRQKKIKLYDFTHVKCKNKKIKTHEQTTTKINKKHTHGGRQQMGSYQRGRRVQGGETSREGRLYVMGGD